MGQIILITHTLGRSTYNLDKWWRGLFDGNGQGDIIFIKHSTSYRAPPGSLLLLVAAAAVGVDAASWAVAEGCHNVDKRAYP